jgi:hypothetical protein
MATDAGEQLAVQLAQLEEEERALSLQRRRLQDRIDLFLGGGAPHDVAGEEMRELRGRERELSERRRQLHDQIDLLRARRDAGAAAPDAAA